jgi:release factor glutamine methyltransferase
MSFAMAGINTNGKDFEATWSLLESLRWTSERFEREGLDSPRLDAEVLLAWVLGVDRLRLYIEFDKPMAADELASYREAIRRRLAREPVAYIVGQKEFWSLAFSVGPGVLVPRPETELMVELALAQVDRRFARDGKPLVVVDVGTGSGAIAVALAHERPELEVHAIDAEERAVQVARQNAARHAVRLSCWSGNLLEGWATKGEIDLVLANLPYVRTDELAQLAPEIRLWEPVVALDGGKDGLQLIRRLVPQAAERLSDRGYLALECDPAQVAAVAQTMRQRGFSQVSIHRDLAGHERIVSGTRSSRPDPCEERGTA